MSADLAVRLGAIRLENPIVTASGCFASGQEIDRFIDVDRIGAVVVKSVTRLPREGLPTPRMVETPSGMLNAIGLQNPGIDGWLAHDLPWLVELGATTVVSIAGDTVDDFVHVARRLRGARVAAIEVNLSCPNVEHRGLVFALDPAASAEVIRGVARVADVPVLAKLSADASDVVAVARAVVDAGAAGLTLINTVLGMAIDPVSGRVQLANGYGGLSGPAIRPIAVRVVHQVHTALPQVPIVGCGGVRSVEDVVQFLRAGATAVAVGTGTFVDPFAAATLRDGLGQWLDRHGYAAAAELVGDGRAAPERWGVSTPVAPAVSGPAARLAVALDVPTLAEAETLARSLAGSVGWFKVGLELFVAHGPEAVAAIGAHGPVFLDLKLHDIPTTVARAVRTAAGVGAGLLTVHAAGGPTMLRAAREAAGDDLRLVAVTVLTSMGAEDLAALRLPSAAERVPHLAALAVEAGLDALVCAPLDLGAVRAAVGAEPLLITPGIRSGGAGSDDHARALGPAEAVAAGADLLVVGRPITRAEDPARAAAELTRILVAARDRGPVA